VWVVSGWKTVKRAAALRQSFIALLAYSREPYSSRSKLFQPFLDYDSWGASRRGGCGMTVLAMILTTGGSVRATSAAQDAYGIDRGDT
jgi:hypothetical protein